MTIVDVSFGIFAFMPGGWLFMAFVIISECFIVSRYMVKRWPNRRIYWAVGGSNIISGVIGILASLALNGGWYLVVWFPWVSKNEVNIHNKVALLGMFVFYIASFVVSIIIELITNILFLKKNYSSYSIIKATIIANIATYLVGSIILYTYSFGIM